MIIHYIYRIVNRVNNKQYVGYTSQNPPEKRWEKHIVDIHSTETKHRPIYRALRKYGIENFSFEVIYCSMDAAHTLNIMENYFIEEYNTHITESGYNLTKGGEGNYGWIPCEKTRLMWSAQRTGKTLSEEHKKKISDGMNLRYKNHPELREYFRQLAIKNNTRPPRPSKEAMKRSGITRTGGHIHTEAHKQNLRDLFKQRKHPFQDPTLMKKRKKTWQEMSRNVGAKNPLAVFCKVFNPENELVGNGYLRDVCAELKAPFDTFLRAQRHGKKLQRGKWKGWQIIKTQHNKS